MKPYILILLLLVLIVFIIFITSKINTKNTKLQLSTQNTESENIKTIYTYLTDGFNSLLQYISNMNINSGGVTGTLNNLHLNDIISGTGTQFITNPLPDLEYEYGNLVLLNFAKNLKFGGSSIRLNKVINNNQIINLYVTANTKKLECFITANGHLTYLGSTVRGECSNIPIIF